MRTPRLLLGTLAGAVTALAGLVPLSTSAQTPFVMSGGNYSENFSTINNWNNLTAGATATAFTGTGAGATPASRFGRLATATVTVADGIGISQNTVFNTGSSGGVQRNTTSGAENIQLLATGTGNASGFDILLDFTGRNAGTLTFDWAQVANGAAAAPNTRPATLQIYTSTNGTTFTQLGSDITVVNNTASSGTFSQTLPASFNGSATARVRFYYHSIATPANSGGGGNRPKISIDNVAATSTASGGTPAFSGAASVSTANTVKGTPSSSTSVSFSGANLTSNITVTTASPFEVSTDGVSWGTNATIPQALTGSLFVRLNSASAGVFSGSISYSGGGVSPTPANTSVSGTALATEPTVQPTVTLSNETSTTIDVTISGGNGQKYLVAARPATAFLNTMVPVDGTTYTPNLNYTTGTSTIGTVVTKVVSTSNALTFTISGLTSNTVYYVGAFSYNDDAAAGAENYLTAGFPATSPSNANTANTSTLAPPPNIYLWTGPANGSYKDKNNWTSQAGSAIGAGLPRSTPAAEDILRFPTGTSSVLFDTTANVQIGGMILANSASVTITLNGATDRTITLSGTVTGDDFVVPSGSTLFLRNNANGAGLKLTMTSPSTGTVGGTVDVDGTGTAPTINTADHVLTGFNLTFSNGSMFKIGTRTSGTSLAGTVTMQNGSTVDQSSGSTIANTVVLQPTSTVIYNVTGGTLGVSGRTYGNLTIKAHGASASSGAGALSINNIVVDGATTFPLAVTGGITINGNVTTMNGGTLSFVFPSSSNVTFTAANPVFSTVNPVSFSNATLTKQGGGTLTIDNLATGANALTLASGTNVEVSNSLTFGNGNLATGGNTLTLLSDASAPRQAYIRNTGTGNVTGGSATIQRAVMNSTYSGTGYRHYSSPVTGADVNDLTTGSFTPVVNPAYNTALNPTAPGAVVPYPNVFSYDPTLVTANTSASFLKGYQSPATSADPLTVGKGYTVRKNTSMVDFVGTPVTGNRTLTLTGNGSLGGLSGWNLLGNPYPSGLDWQAVRSGGAIPSGMSASIAIYRATGNASGFYDPVTGLGGDPLNKLPLGQGFFARKTNSAASLNLNLTNAMRSNDGGVTTFQRQSPNTTTDVPFVKMAISNVAAPEIQPKTIFYFDANATLGNDDYYDGMAVGRSDGDVPTLVSLINGDEAAVNALPLQSLGGADVVVPMLVATPVGGNYKVSLHTILNVPAGVQVILEDVVTGNSQDLTANPTYAFYSDANYAGQRFNVRFTAGRVTGMSHDLTASALNVFPNPATGSVRVSAPAGSLVRVFDAVGREVRTARINAAGAEITLPLTGLQAGLYTVRAGAASQKLVVQ